MHPRERPLFTKRLVKLFRSLMGKILSEICRYFLKRSSVRLGDGSHLFPIQGENPSKLILDDLKGEVFEFLVALLWGQAFLWQGNGDVGCFL